MAQNKIPWRNIVSVAHSNGLPLVMLNTKHLLSGSYQIWNNAMFECLNTC